MMQQSELGNMWYFITDTLGLPRWFAETVTIALALLSLMLLWYYCIKGIFFAKIESKDQSKVKKDLKDRSLRT